MSETETTDSNVTKVVTFLDTVGRTIVGEEVADQTNDTILTVKNPVVLHVVPQDQTGRMSVQLLPIFFREFLADKTGDVTFSYKKATITESNIDTFDFRLKSQYDQMFNKSNIFVPPNGGQVTPAGGDGSNPAIINLFDE
jgi:hypothetical protein